MNLRANDNFRTALNVGTTLTTRIWLALAMLLYGTGFLFNEGSFLVSPSFRALNSVIDIQWWGVVYTSVGFLAAWRVLSPRSKPICAWLVNGAVFFVWFGTTLLRIWNGGNINPASLLSIHSALLIAAGWVLMRTEATARDTETA